jgi:hypothetical protein
MFVSSFIAASVIPANSCRKVLLRNLMEIFLLFWKGLWRIYLTKGERGNAMSDGEIEARKVAAQRISKR